MELTKNFRTTCSTQYMESINALLIQQGLPLGERLFQLNKVARTQMKSLLESKAIKKLK